MVFYCIKIFYRKISLYCCKLNVTKIIIYKVIIKFYKSYMNIIYNWIYRSDLSMKEKILVVEDDEEIALCIKEYVENNGL